MCVCVCFDDWCVQQYVALAIAEPENPHLSLFPQTSPAKSDLESSGLLSLPVIRLYIWETAPTFAAFSVNAGSRILGLFDNVIG